MEKMATRGARFMPGEALFRIADLSRIWLQLDIAEQDLAAAKIGSTVKVTLDAYPGETFTGKVDFIYPMLNTETRTAKVRVILTNPGNKLKPGLYAQAELTSRASGNTLVIPDSAVIDSGLRQHFRHHPRVQENLPAFTRSVEEGHTTPAAAAYALLDYLKH